MTSLSFIEDRNCWRVASADRMALIRSGAGDDQLSKLPATSQTADIAGLSEALASVTA